MRSLLLILLTLLIQSGFAQQQKFSTFYEQRASLFSVLPGDKEDIVFLGNSITNGGEWHELFRNPKVRNRGISGDVVEGVRQRLGDILRGKPSKLFLMIGINDIAQARTIDSIAEGIEKIIVQTSKESPDTKLYLQSTLPVNPDFEMFSNHMKPDSIQKLNGAIRNLAEKYKLDYIDLYSEFIFVGTDKLSPAYTNDGLHLLGQGYLLWSRIIGNYINE